MHRARGFTLLELMIVIVVVAILAAVALPSYTDFITRSKFAEPQGILSDLRVRMEQYYLDNRRYSSTAGGGTCGLPGGNSPTVSNAKYFTYTCASGTNTATGVVAEATDGIAFTIDQNQTRATSVTGGTMSAKGYTSNAGCWVRKKPSTC